MYTRIVFMITSLMRGSISYQSIRPGLVLVFIIVFFELKKKKVDKNFAFEDQEFLSSQGYCLLHWIRAGAVERVNLNSMRGRMFYCASGMCRLGEQAHVMLGNPMRRNARGHASGDWSCCGVNRGWASSQASLSGSPWPEVDPAPVPALLSAMVGFC